MSKHKFERVCMHYMVSRSLVDLNARYLHSWDFGLEHQVRLISNELHQLASTFQNGKYAEAIVHGDTAYGFVTALISFLESEPNPTTR